MDCEFFDPVQARLGGKNIPYRPLPVATAQHGGTGPQASPKGKGEKEALWW